ncbi:hypothetical protein LK542_09910 [Massilia sp. IC2-477]|uniref:hypothetical protein n=1 Tax=Massilia sp. IC2-477 TaxID=2887198 RepID=UPI001D11192D|nr:hypothetical protein [Massilia sp. IC2-477]MCC2955927.1 hypothetical protein [Massilia sp. IC2-477]
MKTLIFFFAAMLAMSQAVAGPGAHGPNGEHLDAPAASTGAALPRIETFTEAFELVGQLSGGELSIMIDRYETNEPVLNGVLEVQYKNLKVKASFHADMGDYAVDDPALLAALSKPGAHPLLFTFVAGEESDLLEGTLQVVEAAEGLDHDHPHSSWWPWLLAAVAAAVLAVAVFVVRRRQRKGAGA